MRIKSNPLITNTLKGSGFPSPALSILTLIGLWTATLILVREVLLNTPVALGVQLVVFAFWLILPIVSMVVASLWMKGEQARSDFLMLRQSGLSDQAITQGYALSFLVRLRFPLIIFNGLLPLVIGRLVPDGFGGLIFLPSATSDSVLTTILLLCLSLIWCTLGTGVAVFASLGWSTSGRWLTLVGGVGVLMVGGARLLFYLFTLPGLLALPVLQGRDLLENWAIYLLSVLVLAGVFSMPWRMIGSEVVVRVERVLLAGFFAGSIGFAGYAQIFKDQYHIDRNALLALGMNGRSEDHCNWDRVQCESGLVTELTINYQTETTLSPAIGKLANLKVLSVNRCWISTLPPEIGRLADLERLYLSDNRLNTLPPEIGELTNLESLHVSRNRLSILPPEIGQLANLKRLYLSDNSLSTLPPEIGQLSSLESLHASGNSLSTLPPEFNQLTGLSYISLEDNQLQSLPPEISLFPELMQLGIYDNPIRQLPVELCPLLPTISADDHLVADFEALCEGEQ